MGVPAAYSCAAPPLPKPGTAAPCATSTQLPAGTVTIVIMLGRLGSASTSLICAGVRPRMVPGSAMNERLGKLGGEHSGQ
jgi:hypothetical protein